MIPIGKKDPAFEAKKRKAAMPPMLMVAVGKKAAPDVPDESEPPIPDAAEEADETPAYESSEDYGAKLMADIESAGMTHGLDPAASRAFAADLFDSVAKRLRGDVIAEHDAGGMEMEGAE